MITSYNGIPFQPKAVDERIEWHKQVSSYITGRKGNIHRHEMIPQSFKVNGYLAGEQARLFKDLITKSLESEKQGKLIHPVFGVREVECLRFEPQGKDDYFDLNFEFKDASSSTDITSKIFNRIQEAEDVLQEAAITIASYITQVQAGVASIDRIAQILEDIGTWATSEVGVGFFTAVSSYSKDSSGRIRDALQKNSPEKVAENIIKEFQEFPFRREIAKHSAKRKTEPGSVESPKLRYDLPHRGSLRSSR